MDARTTGGPDDMAGGSAPPADAGRAGVRPADDTPEVTAPAQEDAAAERGLDLARQALAGAQRGSARRAAAARSTQQNRRKKANRAANVAAGRAGYSAAGADPRDPQPAATVLSGLMAQMGWGRPFTEARIFAEWGTLVGPDVAAHCQPESLRDGELRVSAQSTAWATQIRMLGRTLVHRVNSQLGSAVVVRMHVSGPAGPSWRHGPRSVPGARGPRDTYG
jgi:predicted nucleic acid-binding Zn ribbon protein